MGTNFIRLAVFAAFGISTANAETLFEPRMTIAKGQYEGPRVALTFDACTGKVDDRILSALIENHGAKHLAAIDVPMTVFGLKTAGSPKALQTEIDGGALAVMTTFDMAPHWYRGAAALYTKSSEDEIANINFKLQVFRSQAMAVQVSQKRKLLKQSPLPKMAM